MGLYETSMESTAAPDHVESPHRSLTAVVADRLREAIMTPESLSSAPHVAYAAGMTGNEKLLERILAGDSDAGVSFNELRNLLRWLGFEESIRGGHHLFRKAKVRERINLQRDGRRAKVYQVRQVRRILRSLVEDE